MHNFGKQIRRNPLQNERYVRPTGQILWGKERWLFMKKMFSILLAAVLLLALLTIPAFASDSDEQAPVLENTVSVQTQKEEVLCSGCGKVMHTDLEKRPQTVSEWKDVGTFVCNHHNGAMYTVDTIQQRQVITTYFCDACGTKQIIAENEYRDTCNFKK